MICRIERHGKASVIMTPLQHLLEMGILSSDIEHRQDFLELSDQKDYQVAINLMC